MNELEENDTRKDLTPYERSKKITDKAERTGPTISSTMKEKDSRGRKSVHVVPKKDIANALGIGEASLIRAEQHVAAVQQYPELANPTIPQKDAIAIARNLESKKADR